LARVSPTAVIPLLARALVSEDFEMREEAKRRLVSYAVSKPKEVMRSVGKVMLSKRFRYHFFFDKDTELFKAIPLSVVTNWLHRVGVMGARCIARHLPPPFIDENHTPRVPEITAYVLDHFAADDRTFREFCAGVGSMEFYDVEGGKKRERDALVAEQFLNHPLRRIQEWAKIESQEARADAQRERMEHEEEMAFF